MADLELDEWFQHDEKWHPHRHNEIDESPERSTT